MSTFVARRCRSVCRVDCENRFSSVQATERGRISDDERLRGEGERRLAGIRGTFRDGAKDGLQELYNERGMLLSLNLMGAAAPRDRPLWQERAI